MGFLQAPQTPLATVATPSLFRSDCRLPNMLSSWLPGFGGPPGGELLPVFPWAMNCGDSNTDRSGLLGLGILCSRCANSATKTLTLGAWRAPDGPREGQMAAGGTTQEEHTKQKTQHPALALTPPSSCPSGLLCLLCGGQPAAQLSSASALCSRPWILGGRRDEEKKVSERIKPCRGAAALGGI